MFERIQKLLDRLESRLALLAILSGTSAMGVISAGVAAATEWIGAYGPIGWLSAGLVGALTTAVFLLIVAMVRYWWAGATAVSKWKNDVDTLNPLDKDFSKKVIRPNDLAHPLNNVVDGKRFTECRIQGPATIAFYGETTVARSKFGACDIVVVKPQGASINNVVVFRDCDILDSEIIDCTIYITAVMVNQYAGMDSNFVTLTGFPKVDKIEALKIKEKKKQ